jgi:hypothetical protein
VCGTCVACSSEYYLLPPRVWRPHALVKVSGGAHSGSLMCSMSTIPALAGRVPWQRVDVLFVVTLLKVGSLIAHSM